MTKQRYGNDDAEKKFGDWLRLQPEIDSKTTSLSISNVDFIIHKYIVRDSTTGRRMARQHLMFVEHKAIKAVPPFSQTDTMAVLSDLFESRHKHVIESARGKVKLFYHGYHCLMFRGGATPDDSESILWSVGSVRKRVAKEINREQLFQLLRFEIDADTLQKREDRDHHALGRQDLLWDEQET